MFLPEEPVPLRKLSAAVMAVDLQYSLHILLPEQLNRRFARWAANTTGASWPSWGGHVTLLAPFTLLVPFRDFEAGLLVVAARHAPLEVHLTDLTVIPDWTRQGYYAVFLAPPAEVGSGLRRLTALQRDLGEQLAPLRVDRFPEIVRREYLPHVTLALGLSETEAHKMVGAARSDGLVAEFRVEQIWLKQDGEPVEKVGEAPTGRMTPYALSSPIP